MDSTWYDMTATSEECGNARQRERERKRGRERGRESRHQIRGDAKEGTVASDLSPTTYESDVVSTACLDVAQLV